MATNQQLQATTKLFISYSRRDHDVVAHLVRSLLMDPEFQIFRDTEDILPSEEWKKRLESLILAADTVVFCLSPDSANSEVCAWEVKLAEDFNKRIVPFVIREVDNAVPKGLSKLNYIMA